MTRTLRDVQKNCVVGIVDVVSGHPLSERLVELGFMAGEKIQVIHEAPFSRDPIVVECGGTRIALRRAEAELVLVSLSEPGEGERP